MYPFFSGKNALRLELENNDQRVANGTIYEGRENTSNLQRKYVFEICQVYNNYQMSHQVMQTKMGSPDQPARLCALHKPALCLIFVTILGFAINLVCYSAILPCLIKMQSRRKFV